uniref:Uncharacterized protein n=1 Tax=Knipowitschia caucasica TaxID=637954 RepID=A0AAV2J1S2_KNICA
MLHKPGRAERLRPPLLPTHAPAPGPPRGRWRSAFPGLNPWKRRVSGERGAGLFSASPPPATSPSLLRGHGLEVADTNTAVCRISTVSHALEPRSRAIPEQSWIVHSSQ